jgi:hypothetical protein
VLIHVILQIVVLKEDVVLRISYAFIENDVLVDYDVSDVMCHHLKRSFNHLTS